MDSYELDNAAYSHMRKHGIHRTKKSGPRKGQTIHETVGGKPFHAKHNALKSKTGGFDHEQHAKHNRNIEAIDKKFGIGAHDPKRFK